MTYATRSRFIVRSVLLVNLWGTAWLLVAPAAAQQSPNGPVEETELVRVYTVKHADSEVLFQFAAEAIPGARIALDPPLRRLIVSASQADHARLKELIKAIDVLPETDKKQIKVFRLLNSDARSMLEVVARIVRNKKVDISVDHRTNSLLAAGSEESLKVIEAVLVRLDESSTPGLPEKTFRVRIVWFAEGDSGDAEPVDDLRIVTDELSKTGAGAMIPVGQTLVSAVPGAEFQVSCSTTFGDGPAELEIKGQLDVMQLKIEIRAMREQAVGDAKKGSVRRLRLVNLATEITAPLHHFVVLGITPVEEKTLAFAVQILPTD